MANKTSTDSQYSNTDRTFYMQQPLDGTNFGKGGDLAEKIYEQLVCTGRVENLDLHRPVKGKIAKIKGARQP